LYVSGYGAYSQGLLFKLTASSGAVQWLQYGYGPYYGVAVDSAGNPHTTGYTTDGDYDYNTLDVVKYDGAGNVTLTTTVADCLQVLCDRRIVGQSIAIDSTDNVYVGGWAQSPIFGAMQGAGTYDAILAKFSMTNGARIYGPQF